MANHYFVICVNNSDYPASLEFRKIYECIPDDRAYAMDQLRVIDESGEDYLYPKESFIRVELSDSALSAIKAVA